MLASVPLMLLTLLTAGPRAGAGAGAAWPACPPTSARSDCAAADPSYTDDWDTRDYLVDGGRLSVSIREGGEELRLRCARGASLSSAAAPRFAAPHPASAVQLIACLDSPLLDQSYPELLQNFNINTTRLTIVIRQTHTFDVLLTKMPLSELSILSEREMVQLENDFSHFDDTLKRLSLQQISITADQFNSARNVVDLSLVDTDLEEIPTMSQFTRLERLVVREPRLLNTAQLTTAPALRDLTLEAPDAGIPNLPLLQNATFINVYMMERFFGNCSNLESLVIERGSLSVLRPGLLAGCSRLRRLRLTRLPRLTVLPPALLADNAALQHLDLSHNALETLPTALLADTVALIFLDLSHNKLSALPNDLLKHTEYLTHLNVSDNLLLLLPDDLLVLIRASHFPHLGLSCNHLAEISDTLLNQTGLLQLRNLDFSHNQYLVLC